MSKDRVSKPCNAGVSTVLGGKKTRVARWTQGRRDAGSTGEGQGCRREGANRRRTGSRRAATFAPAFARAGRSIFEVPFCRHHFGYKYPRRRPLKKFAMAGARQYSTNGRTWNCRAGREAYFGEDVPQRRGLSTPQIRQRSFRWRSEEERAFLTRKGQGELTARAVVAKALPFCFKTRDAPASENSLKTEGGQDHEQTYTYRLCRVWVHRRQGWEKDPLAWDRQRVADQERQGFYPQARCCPGWWGTLAVRQRAEGDTYQRRLTGEGVGGHTLTGSFFSPALTPPKPPARNGDAELVCPRFPAFSRGQARGQAASTFEATFCRYHFGLNIPAGGPQERIVSGAPAESLIAACKWFIRHAKLIHIRWKLADINLIVSSRLEGEGSAIWCRITASWF